MERPEINISDYRSPKSGCILAHKIRKDGVFDMLAKMYPWCPPTASHLVYCYENNLTCMPLCKTCGNPVKTPKANYCSKRCTATDHETREKCLAAATEANTNRTPWNKGLKHQDTSWHAKHKSPEKWETAKSRISSANSGENNGMFRWRERMPEVAERQSETMKDKILRGDYTPNTNNRKTHFDVEYDGRTFRSSWEAVFKQLNPSCEYETVRIPYVSESGANRVYIADFYDPDTKTVIEIRPDELFDDGSNKFKAADEYCKIHGLKFKHVGIDYFVDHETLIDYSVLGSDIERRISNAIEKRKRNRKA